jgi:hypothetical protein
MKLKCLFVWVILQVVVSKFKAMTVQRKHATRKGQGKIRAVLRLSMVMGCCSRGYSSDDGEHRWASLIQMSHHASQLYAAYVACSLDLLSKSTCNLGAPLFIDTLANCGYWYQTATASVCPVCSPHLPLTA